MTTVVLAPPLTQTPPLMLTPPLVLTPPSASHLLISRTLQAVNDSAQPDIKQPDLSVQVVNFLF